MNVGGAVSERLRFGLLLIWLMKHVVTAVCAVGGVSGQGISTNNKSNKSKATEWDTERKDYQRPG